MLDQLWHVIPLTNLYSFIVNIVWISFTCIIEIEYFCYTGKYWQRVQLWPAAEVSVLLKVTEQWTGVSGLRQ